jgi:hypothetical protein
LTDTEADNGPGSDRLRYYGRSACRAVHAANATDAAITIFWGIQPARQHDFIICKYYEAIFLVTNNA